jgi:hypothetical protein
MVDFIQPLPVDLVALVEVLDQYRVVILVGLDLNQHQLFMEPLLDMEQMVEMLHILVPISAFLAAAEVLVVLA